jgi:hypothetical protein
MGRDRDDQSATTALRVAPTRGRSCRGSPSRRVVALGPNQVGQRRDHGADVVRRGGTHGNAAVDERQSRERSNAVVHVRGVPVPVVRVCWWRRQSEVPSVQVTVSVLACPLSLPPPRQAGTGQDERSAPCVPAFGGGVSGPGPNETPHLEYQKKGTHRWQPTSTAPN